MSYRDEDEQWEMPAAPKLTPAEIEMERKAARRKEIERLVCVRENYNLDADRVAENRVWKRDGSRVQMFVDGTTLVCVDLRDGQQNVYATENAELAAEAKTLVN